MIRCGLISKYLKIKSPSLLIYRSHFKRFVSLSHTCTLSHGQILPHTNKCKTIALKLLSCLFNCHFLLGRHTITNMLYFVGEACPPTLFSFFYWKLNLLCTAVLRLKPFDFNFDLTLGYHLLFFFTSCLSKGAANPITSTTPNL